MRILFAVIFVLFSYVSAWADCTGSGMTYSCTAGSTAAQVQAAVNTSSAGATITLASGAYSWTSAISISRAITITGSPCSLDSNRRPTSCSTVITLSGNAAFNLGGGDNGEVRLENFYFTGSVSTSKRVIGVRNNWSYVIVGKAIVRVTGEEEFFKYGTSREYLYPATSKHKALLYSIDYTTTTANSSKILLVDGRDATWLEDDDFGTDNAIFIEDSILKNNWSPSTSAYRFITDTESGARLVIRNNLIDNAQIATHDLANRIRGQRLIEMYNNTMTCSSNHCDSTGALALRGGAGLFYNNTVTGNYYTGWANQIYRRDSTGDTLFKHGYCGQSQSACSNSGTGIALHCSTSSSDTSCYYPGQSCTGGGTCVMPCTSDSQCPSNDCIKIDGTGSGDYPCRDQNGAVKDNEDGTIGTLPFYVWNNTLNGSTINANAGSYGVYLQSGRDYCNSSPASACGSTGAWTYTAYTYPHPKQSTSSYTPDTTPPVLSVQSPAATVDCTSDPMNITEQVGSDEAATARFATAAEYAAGDDTFDEMNTVFTTTGGVTHSRVISRACGASYTIWGAAQNVAGLKSTPIELTYTIGAAEPETPVFIDGTKFGENSAATVQGVCTDTYLNDSEADTVKHLSASLGFYTDPDATGGHSTILEFDLSSIPTNATVTAAKLYLNLTSYDGDATYEVTAHKITGKATVVSQATWNSAATGLAWTAAGGLSDVAASESTEVVGTSLTWYEWSIPTMVAQWVATPATNYGVLLASDQTVNTATSGSYRYFASSNKSDATLRPILIVAYTIPDPGTPGESAKTINLTGGTLTIKPSGGSLTITW